MGTAIRTFNSEDHGEEQEQVPCPLCGADSTRDVLSSPDLLFDRPGRYPLVRCNECDLQYVNPRPTPQAIGPHYPEAYMCYIPPEETHWSIRPAIKWFARGLSRKRIALLEDVTGRLTPDTSMVDVGCGTNDLLYNIRELRGTTGIGLDFKKEICEQVESKRNMPMVHGTLETAGFSDGQFDVVTMMEYLEHEHSPRSVLQQARRITKTGGHLAIEIPHIAGVPARVFGGAWFNLDLPRHLVFFSEDTLRRMLDECGFELVSARPFGLPWYVGSSLLHALGYRFSEGFKFGPLFAGILGTPLLPFTPLIREFMFAVARAK